MFYSSIFLSGTIANTFLTLAQAFFAIRFYLKTRKIKEVGWMSHCINGLTLITGITQTISQLEYYLKQGHGSFQTVNIVICRFSSIVNYRLIIRMIRTQVQINSSQEKTKVIFKAIFRSKVIEWVMLFLLLVIMTSVIAQYLPNGLVPKSISSQFYYVVFTPA